MTSAPPLTWLYVPADRPDRVEKAIASRAHAVIVDLEDGSPPGARPRRGPACATLLAGARDKPVLVRVNRGDDDDLAAVEGLAGRRRRPPEGRRPEDVPAVDLPVRCLIESAVGVEAAFAIASTPGVAGISLGEADLRSETGALEAGLDWARSRIVNAAVAAGLPRPPQSVYPFLRDDDGLARSCARGRELGHLGRMAIHPEQLEIDRARVPPDGRGARAGARDDRDRSRPTAAGTLADGEFVDPAMLGAARLVVALAERYGIAGRATEHALGSGRAEHALRGAGRRGRAPRLRRRDDPAPRPGRGDRWRVLALRGGAAPRRHAPSRPRARGRALLRARGRARLPGRGRGAPRRARRDGLRAARRAPRAAPRAAGRRTPARADEPGGFERFFRALADAHTNGTLGPEAYERASRESGITWLGG